MMDVQNKRLHRDLNHSEAFRMEAERKAALAAAEVTRLEDVANQLEETKSENKSLTNQVFGSFMFHRFVCRHFQTKRLFFIKSVSLILIGR